jgi:protein-tyrosine phosphatase
MVEIRSDTPLRSVLFVCQGNTCRSLLAQTLARKRFGTSLLVSSAGLEPQSPEDAKWAIETLSGLGFNVSWHVPRDVRTVDLETYDFVVAMDNSVASGLREMTNRNVTAWDIEDPWGKPDDHERCAHQIEMKLDDLSW